MREAKTKVVDEPAVASVVDVNKLESLGQEVVGAMRQVRELLDARASALESCRQALEAYHEQLGSDRDALTNQENELCNQLESREQAIAAREKECVERERQAAEAARKHESAESLVTEAEKQLADATAAFERKRAEWELQHGDLAAARADLDKMNAAIAAESDELNQRRSSLADQEESLRKREAELSALAASLGEKEREAADLHARADTLRKEWELRMSEVNAARESLGALQRQLESELNKVTEQKTDLLPRFGMTESGLASGQPADRDIPKVQEKDARSAMERFQKLCRDAKRKAVGA
jgi:chromosome segregation ATPase